MNYKRTRQATPIVCVLHRQAKGVFLARACTLIAHTLKLCPHKHVTQSIPFCLPRSFQSNIIHAINTGAFTGTGSRLCDTDKLYAAFFVEVLLDIFLQHSHLFFATPLQMNQAPC